jgi:glycosyltransferase involved in cell wall biosynthesis
MPEKPVTVLIITYYWPPSGGAGVQRWLKFSKYLPEFGCVPIILTVDPEYATYPVIDDSLTEELPFSVKVYKTHAIDYFGIYKKDKSKIPSAGFANSADNTLKGKILRFIRGNFFIPDPRRGWNKFAFRKACEIIESEGIKHVITTSPPHSTQLIGLKLKKKYPLIKWVADLRDPWTDIYYYRQFYPTIISKIIDRRYEKQVLKVSDKIITVGKSLKDHFSAKINEVGEKTEIITNGYDQNDFEGLAPLSPAIFTISYIGTLSDAYPVEGFLEALKGFKENGNNLRLIFTGTVSPKQKELILSVPGCSATEFVNYVDHKTALRYMVESTALLLIIPDHKGNKSIITGKLFEYIAAGKPVICLGPADGDAAEILRETGHGITFSYQDSNGILEYLRTLSSGKAFIEKISPKVFCRSELTRKVVSLLQKP